MTCIGTENSHSFVIVADHWNEKETTKNISIIKNKNNLLSKITVISTGALRIEVNIAQTECRHS